jgi:hypothetical protein
MSAKGPIADVSRRAGKVAEVPRPEIRTGFSFGRTVRAKILISAQGSFLRKKDRCWGGQVVDD